MLHTNFICVCVCVYNRIYTHTHAYIILSIIEGKIREKTKIWFLPFTNTQSNRED